MAVLATERAQFERKRELENALDDLANELEEIVAAEANKKGSAILLFSIMNAILVKLYLLLLC